MTPFDAMTCSGEMVQIVLEASSVVLDAEEMTALFSAAGLREDLTKQAAIWSGDQLKALSLAMEGRYGLLGARGTALKVGRAAFPGFVRIYGTDDGFENTEYRLLPVRKRARVGLEKLAAIFDCACGVRVEVTAEPDAWLWTLAECELCEDAGVEAMVSHFMLGLLQAYLGWISGGKVFQVEETACRAEGAANCVIRVLRLPLD